MACTTASILPTPPAPQLPCFQTLLIQGDYPHSSPFHLCLSHMSPAREPHPHPRPIFVTAKNRSNIIERLVDLNDEWLITNAGLGATTELLSRIRIFYPGTPDHWALLFSFFQTGARGDLESLPPNPNIHLDPPVSLVVLHEPSAYFLDNDLPKSFTMYSYLRLITSALASLRSLNPDTRPPPLAVFDSRLHELTLPILPIAMTDPIVGEDEEGSKAGRRHDKIVLAVEKYFEWVGRVEAVSQSPRGSLARYPPGNTHRMYLSPSQFSPDPQANTIMWEWRQTQSGNECDPEETDTGARCTDFRWS